MLDLPSHISNIYEILCPLTYPEQGGKRRPSNIREGEEFPHEDAPPDVLRDHDNLGYPGK